MLNSFFLEGNIKSRHQIFITIQKNNQLTSQSFNFQYAIEFKQKYIIWI